MNKVFKISLLVVIFLTLASVALASFNYDSANNYFLIDSILRTEGNYLLVGNAFNENLKKEDNSAAANFLAVSNSLIFLNRGDASSVGGLFSSGLRQASKNNFSSQAITIDNASQNLLIEPIGGAKSLRLEANRILLNQNFKLQSGLAFDNRDLNQIASKTIYVDKVLATGLQSLTADSLLIPNGTLLNIPASAGNAISANEITFNNQPFCVVKTWNVADNITNAALIYGSFDAGVLASGELSCPDTSNDLSFAKRTCCPQNYFVFDMDATAGKLVCCQAASGQLQLSQLEKKT